MDYLRKEKAAIDAAYMLLEYLAGYDTGGADRLHECLKYEKRQRDSVTISKRLMVEEAAKGVQGFRDGREAVASDLYGFSRGCAYARMLGGDLARRAVRYGLQDDYGKTFIEAVDKFLELAVLSNAAGDQARERWLNRTSDLLREKLGAANA
jgi:hypothetical protein